MHYGDPLIGHGVLVNSVYIDHRCLEQDTSSYLTAAAALLTPAALPSVLADVAATAILALPALPPVHADAASAALCAVLTPSPVLADAAAATVLAVVAQPPVLTDAAAAAILAPPTPPPVLADAAATAILAAVTPPPVLADAAAPTVLALAALPPVLADAAAAALLALAALPTVRTGRHVRQTSGRVLVASRGKSTESLYQETRSSAVRAISKPEGPLNAQGPSPKGLNIDCASIGVGAQLGRLQGACRRRRHPSGPEPRDQGISRRPHGRLVAEREGARAEERGKRGVQLREVDLDLARMRARTRARAQARARAGAGPRAGALAWGGASGWA